MSDATTKQGDAAAIIDAISDLHGHSLLQLPDGNVAVVLPRDMRLESVKPFLDQYRLAPERRRGTCTVQDIDSFVSQVARFQDDDSCVFGVRSESKPSLTCVVNYHRKGPDGIATARCGDHRVVYPFPVSNEWTAWRKADREQMPQADFAAFIEDRITDVLPPPGGSDLTDQRFPGLTTLTGHLRTTWAGPAGLIDLSRGLAVRVGQKVKNAQNLATGETQLQFESEHTDESGAPIKVPGMFMIGIPVFDGGPLYRIAVRLRYRVVASVTWFFEMWRADLVFRHAFDEACKRVAEDTGLPVVLGVPEQAI